MIIADSISRLLAHKRDERFFRMLLVYLGWQIPGSYKIDTG